MAQVVDKAKELLSGDKEHKNQAAWLTGKKEVPFKVDTAPLHKPAKDEVLIKNHALAVNPVDWKVQTEGSFIETFPNILGCDVAGEVVDIGSDVTRFKKGDRVIAHEHGVATNNPAHGGFQLYSSALEILTAHLPSSISYTQGSVVPLALSTAAAGLYQKEQLGLPYPSHKPNPAGKVLLVYGGSSSVGAITIQCAIASGFEVVTTCSKQNEAFCKELGAKWVVDHRSGNVVSQIVSIVKESGLPLAGAYDAISFDDTARACADVVSQLGGGTVATTLWPPKDGLPENVKAVGVYAPSVGMQQKEVGEAVWVKWAEGALESGQLKAKPDPLIFKGLSSVQAAVDKNKEGVSAAKVVIEL